MSRSRKKADVAKSRKPSSVREHHPKGRFKVGRPSTAPRGHARKPRRGV